MPPGGKAGHRTEKVGGLGRRAACHHRDVASGTPRHVLSPRSGGPLRTRDHVLSSCSAGPFLAFAHACRDSPARGAFGSAPACLFWGLPRARSHASAHMAFHVCVWHPMRAWGIVCALGHPMCARGIPCMRGPSHACVGHRMRVHGIPCACMASHVRAHGMPCTCMRGASHVRAHGIPCACAVPHCRLHPLIVCERALLQRCRHPRSRSPTMQDHTQDCMLPLLPPPPPAEHPVRRRQRARPLSARLRRHPLRAQRADRPERAHAAGGMAARATHGLSGAGENVGKGRGAERGGERSHEPPRCMHAPTELPAHPFVPACAHLHATASFCPCTCSPPCHSSYLPACLPQVGTYTYAGCIGLPRVLSIDESGPEPRLVQSPLPEAAALRRRGKSWVHGIGVSDGADGVGGGAAMTRGDDVGRSVCSSREAAALCGADTALGCVNEKVWMPALRSAVSCWSLLLSLVARMVVAAARGCSDDGLDGQQ
eukprot:294377-Chlamydomonas_euryale.AAC.3